MHTSLSVLSRALVLAILGATLASIPSIAGWGPEGATLKSTTSDIMQVAAVNDGARGSLVAWQEGTISAGYLRALHVLSSGDVDAAWPAEGVLICDVPVNCNSLTLLTDGAGGAFAWWLEGGNLYLTRVTSAGAIATGWPSRGRLLGSLFPRRPLPSVIEDCAGGVYAAWGGLIAAGGDISGVRMIHLGPSNTGAAGFPSTPKVVVGGDPVLTWDLWPSLALAPDGGVFAAWASWSEAPGVVPSAMRLGRWTPAGLVASGWSSEGVALAGLVGEALGWDPRRDGSGPGASLIGLAPADGGGVFALLGILESASSTPPVDTRLLRIEGDGSPAVSWPGGGRVIPQGPPWYSVGFPGASMRAISDRRGGVQLGLPFFYDHGTTLSFVSSNPVNNWTPGSAVGGQVDHNDFVLNGAGGMFFAECTPVGPYGPYALLAHLRVDQSMCSPGWTDFYEVHDDGPYQWYGDIALAESGDGGAVFFWSQMRERFGLFARRFNAQGAVTGVGPAVGTAVLSLIRLRFVAGDGVRVSLSIPAGVGAGLDLYDVTGRRVAATRVPGGAAGTREVTVPGTRGLAAGLYLAKLATADGSRGGKVVVAR